MHTGHGNPHGSAGSDTGRSQRPHRPGNDGEPGNRAIPRHLQSRQSTNAASSRQPTTRFGNVDSYRPSQHQGTNHRPAQSSLHIAGGFNAMALTNDRPSRRHSQDNNPQFFNAATDQTTHNPSLRFTGNGMRSQRDNAYQQVQFTGPIPAAGPNRQQQLFPGYDPMTQGPANTLRPATRDILVDDKDIVIGNGPARIGYHHGPWEHTLAQTQQAKSRIWKVGDVVSHEIVRQAWSNPKWEWIDKSTGTWQYLNKDIFFVPGKEQANMQTRNLGHRTIPAVQFLNRYGVIDEIYQDDPFYGRSARIIPMYSYGKSGMREKGTGASKPASWCAEHLSIMHDDDAAATEQEVRDYNNDPQNRRNLKKLERRSPHPDIPWEHLVRLTPGSFFHPEEGSHLRLSATTMVQLQDPRLKYLGELTSDSWEFVRGARAKIQEIASLGPHDRGHVDYGKYRWMAHLDPDKTLHQQQRRETQRRETEVALANNAAPTSKKPTTQTRSTATAPLMAPARKRKVSEVYADPEPAEAESANIRDFRIMLQNMNAEDRRQVQQILQASLQPQEPEGDECVAMSFETDCEVQVEPAAKRTKLNDAVDSKTDDSARQGSEEGEIL